MNHPTRTTGQALGLIGEVLSSIDHRHREAITHEERVWLMNQARTIAERAQVLASVITGEVDIHHSSMHVTNTPLTSFISTTENRDSKDAAAHVFAARDITAHHHVRDAALEGRVTAGHARAIATGMKHLPRGLDAAQKHQAEQAFLTRAGHTTPKQLAKLADEVLAQVAPEKVPDPGDEIRRLAEQQRRAHTKRHFRFGDDGDGSTWFTGSLPHLEATPLITLIKQQVATHRRTARDRATAIRNLKPGIGVLREHGTAEQLTPAQRQADALVAIIAHHRPTPHSPPPPPRVVVTMTATDLRDRAEQAGVLDSGAKISPGDLRRLACSANLIPAVLGTESEVLDVGQHHRLVTPGIRRQLSLRDGGCVFPHCEATDTECEAHHVIPWWNGGPTAAGNLVLLCPHHHAMIEPQRFHPAADQWHIGYHPHTRKPVVHPPRAYKVFLQRLKIPDPNNRDQQGQLSSDAVA